MPIVITIQLDSPNELDAWKEKLEQLIGSPQPAAAKATRGATAKQAEARETVEKTNSAPSTVIAAAEPAQIAAVVASSTTLPEAASTPSSEADAPVAITQGDLTAAANAAVAALGSSGPAKVKAHIAATFTQPDGSPGTLLKTRPEQQADLLASLQKIARKELML